MRPRPLALVGLCAVVGACLLDTGIRYVAARGVSSQELTVVTQTGDGAPGIVINIEKTNGGVTASTGRGFGPEPIRVAETYAHPLDQRFDIGDQVVLNPQVIEHFGTVTNGVEIDTVQANPAPPPPPVTDAPTTRTIERFVTVETIVPPTASPTQSPSPEPAMWCYAHLPKIEPPNVHVFRTLLWIFLLDLVLMVISVGLVQGNFVPQGLAKAALLVEDSESGDYDAEPLSGQLFPTSKAMLHTEAPAALFLQLRHVLLRGLFVVMVLAVVVLLPLNFAGDVFLNFGWQFSLFNVRWDHHANFAAHALVLLIGWFVLLFSICHFVATAKRWLKAGELQLSHTPCASGRGTRLLFTLEMIGLFVIQLGLSVGASALLAAAWELPTVDAESSAASFGAFASAYFCSLLFAALGAVVIPTIVLWRVGAYFDTSGCSPANLLCVFFFGLAGAILHSFVVPALFLWRTSLQHYSVPYTVQSAVANGFSQALAQGTSAVDSIFGLAEQDIRQASESMPMLAAEADVPLVVFARIMLGGGWALLAAFVIHVAMLAAAFRLVVVGMNASIFSSPAIRDGYYVLLGAQSIVTVVAALLIATLYPLFTPLAVVYFFFEAWIDHKYFAHVESATVDPRAGAHQCISFVTVALPIMALIPVAVACILVPSGDVIPPNFGWIGALLLMLLGVLFIASIANRFLIVKTIEVKPLSVDPSRCVAYGDGLRYGKETEEAFFTVQANDSSGMPFKGGCSITFDLSLQDIYLAGHVKNNRDGTYSCRYTGGPEGVYTLRVYVDGSELGTDSNGSPFKVSIAGVEVCPPKCSAEGPGLSYCEVGKEATFVLQTRTATDSPISLHRHSADIQLAFTCPAGRPAACAFTTKELALGRYEIRYKTENSGMLKLHCRVLGQDIARSPFDVQSVLDVPIFSAHGDGLSHAVAHCDATFVVAVISSTTAKPYNLPSKRGLGIKLSKEGKALSAPTSVVERAPGQYAVKYRCDVPGSYELAVTHQQENIPGSPWNVMVEAGRACGLKCRASGEGLRIAKQGQAASFRLEVNDAHSVRIVEAVDVDIVVSGPDEEVVGYSQSESDGSYACSYTPNGNGNYSLIVKADGEAVAGSPFRVKVAPADADPPSCIAEGAGLREGTGCLQAVAHRDESLIVHTFALDGTVATLPKRGAELAATFTFDGQRVMYVSRVSEVSHGKYRLAYKAEHVGQHQLAIILNGEHIYGSPFDLLVGAGDIDALKCKVSGEGVSRALRDEPALVLVEAFDSYGNRIRRGGDSIEVSAHGPQGDEAVGFVTDLNDGTYSAAYVPRQSGNYKLSVSAASKAAKGSPFNVKVKSMQPCARKCIATGKGLKQPVAESAAAFSVDIFTEDGDRVDLHYPTTELELAFAPSNAGVNVGDIVHESAGRYTVSYVAARSGPLSLSISLVDGPIQGSPFAIDVRPSPAERLFLLQPVLGIEIGAEDSSGSGVRVFSVTPNGPSAAAGIRPEDYIYSISQTYMEDKASFERYVLDSTAGDKLVLSIKRQGSEMALNLVVGAVGMSAEDVNALRREADISDAIWDRHSFSLSHHWVTREARRLPTDRRSAGGLCALRPYCSVRVLSPPRFWCRAVPCGSEAFTVHVLLYRTRNKGPREMIDMRTVTGEGPET